MALRPGIGNLSPSRLGRGMFRGSGRMTTTFRFLPGWEKATVRELRPSARTMMVNVHKAMTLAMADVSHRPAGGGWEENDDGWAAGIGTPRQTHTHWHLLEFGGGHHYARSPVRNVLVRLGKFEGKGK